MITIKERAEKFFEACETGQGWNECRMYCSPDATFTCQADALSQINTLQNYTEWMKGFFTPVPDGRYELKAFAVDEEHYKVIAFGIFRGIHSGEGGPLPPTGRQVESEYVYVMDFNGDCIQHMTKIWNDGFALKQLGWG
jgi:predicted ester cyclase